jgi:hypothetical protein
MEWFKCPYDLAMNGACINSRQTYYSCLKELQNWNLIEYKPGINNWKAPLVKLLVLSKNGQADGQVDVPVPEQLPILAPEQLPEQVVKQAVEQLTGQLPIHKYKLITNNFKLITDNIETILDFLKNKNQKPIKSKIFIKPTIQEIKNYCIERKNNIDAQYFFDSNEAKGWLVGKTKTPMKDWQAVIRTWENNQKNNAVVKPVNNNPKNVNSAWNQ